MGSLPGCDSAPTAPLSASALEEALLATHLATARALRTGEPADSLRVAALARLGTDTLAVNASLDAYAQRPQVLSDVYARVIDRLTEQQQAIDPSLTPDP